MQNKPQPWLLKWLDLVFILLVLLALLMAFVYIAVGPEIEYAGAASLYAVLLAIPAFIIAKYKGADMAWRDLSSRVTPSTSYIVFTAGRTVRQESFIELPLSMQVPHTYSEFRGGDSVQRLSSRDFPSQLVTSLSGIYEHLSEHVFYCKREDNIEALSLFTPEVLQHITSQNVRCAIETKGNSLRLYSHPSTFVDGTEFEKLQNLALLLQEQINERSNSFNKQNKQFETMSTKEGNSYITNFTDQAKIGIMATTAAAVLTITYASEAGSGNISSPALGIPEWFGVSIVIFLTLSPVLIIIAFSNLQRLATTVRKPMKTLKIGSTHISRGLVVYIVILALMFVTLLFESIDT